MSIICGILLWQPEWNETLDDGFKGENTDSSNWGLRCRKDSEILYIVWDRWLRWDRLNNHWGQRGLRTVGLEDCEHSSHQRWWWYPRRELSKPSECGWITGDRKQLAGKKGSPKKLFSIMDDEDQWGLLLLPSVPCRRIWRWTAFLETLNAGLF